MRRRRGLITTTIRLPRELLLKLEYISMKEGSDRSEIMRRMLFNEVRDYERLYGPIKLDGESEIAAVEGER